MSNQNTSKVVDFHGLSTETGLPVPTLRKLWREKKIPGLVLGFRTIRFKVANVMAAIEKMERTADANTHHTRAKTKATKMRKATPLKLS